jgi:proteasome lid subunit RPN8/RPN11
MSATRDLEEQITRAHERGDRAQLCELQARYRNSADVVRVTRGPVSLIEPERSTTTPVLPTAEERGTLPAVVRVLAEAYQEILAWPFELGLEVGGFLVGRESGGEIIVESVFAAKGGDPLGSRDSVHLDREWAAIVDAKAERSGMHLVGDCHSHVYAEPKLSGTDERGLRGAADAMGRNWVGLVIGRDPDRVGWTHSDLWVRPEIRGYVAPAADNSIRPIAVVIEGRG